MVGKRVVLGVGVTLGAIDCSSMQSQTARFENVTGQAGRSTELRGVMAIQTTVTNQ